MLLIAWFHGVQMVGDFVCDESKVDGDLDAEVEDELKRWFD